MKDHPAMSKAAQKLLDEFDALPEMDRKIVAVEILDRAIVLNGLPAEADELEDLTDEQRAEIDRRLAEHDRDPGSAIPWEEGRARLFQRFS
jgi:putative addiction module component (TIGR02574 family)